jgi:hypothetical protein
MRYCIREATSLDMARIARVMVERSGDWSGSTAGAAVERLQEAWRLSRRVWVTLDSGGLPAALFGIAPMEDADEAVGRFWILALDAFDNGDRDFRAVARLVFDEMLQEFDRVENVIDSGKTRTIDLLKSLGFAIEPATTRAGLQGRFHRAWLSGGGWVETPAN